MMMSKRKLMAAVAAMAVVPAAAASGSVQASAPAIQSGAASRPAVARKPNILFILVDDMGYGDLSLTGNRMVSTPNIDRLAAEGMVMTQFYDAAPICSPSRAGLMTGRFPARSGFVTYVASRQHNRDLGQADWLDPRTPVLARALHDAGYATGHFGKWHLGGGRDIGDAPLPTRYGFDESYTQFEGLGPRALPSNIPNNLARQSARLGQGPIDWILRDDVTARFIDKTLAFTARNRGRPWFAQLWFDDVHAPWIPGDDQLAATDGAGNTPADKRFNAVLKAMDDQIGRLVAELRRQGQLDNTLIVLTSDNGPTAGPRQPGSAGPYRGRKGSLYEGGIRQPLIVRWPGQVTPGGRDASTVGQGVDLYPTLAAIAGAAPPPVTDGIDLSPAWRGRPIATRPDLYYYISRPGGDGEAGPPVSIRSGAYKLLAATNGSGAQLYDIARDPAETRDLAANEPEIVRSLGGKLVAWARALKLPAPRTGAASDAE